MLTVEEEIELAMKKDAGDIDAKNKLIQSNLRFVISVAKQYQNQGLTLPDLINEGNLGLITAANKFDHTKGFKFISYAVWWIRQSIIQSLAENSRSVRLPLNQIGKINKMLKLISKEEQEKGRAVHAQEINLTEDFDQDDLDTAIMLNARAVRLDAFTNDDENNRVVNLIEDPDTIKPDQLFANESLKLALTSIIGKLNSKEQQVMKMLYGLDGTEYRLEEVAEYFNCCSESIRQMRNRCLEKIKKNYGTFLKTL
jgi:RNA polymerase primary sigma factor